eukprot:TRINITY_DN2521_c0_g1_i1.p1 TRINITY_DN2521_c0_g1~~TRINITY_DN2521_c0_g1_i1.p1  ORF type:complete len:204 (+),score=27.11 TRINITY_DN2521_c0_g1_i1:33-614(+)
MKLFSGIFLIIFVLISIIDSNGQLLQRTSYDHNGCQGFEREYDTMVLNKCVAPTFATQHIRSTFVKQINSTTFMAHYCTDLYCADCETGPYVAGTCDNWEGGSVSTSVLSSFPKSPFTSSSVSLTTYENRDCSGDVLEVTFGNFACFHDASWSCNSTGFYQTGKCSLSCACTSIEPVLKYKIGCNGGLSASCN